MRSWRQNAATPAAAKITIDITALVMAAHVTLKTEDTAQHTMVISQG